MAIVPNLAAALAFAASNAKRPDADTFIIGGAQIYRQALPLVDQIYYTEVPNEFVKDEVFTCSNDDLAYFPMLNLKEGAFRPTAHWYDSGLMFMILDRVL